MIKNMVMKRLFLSILFFLLAASAPYPSSASGGGSGQALSDVPFDVVILNGRVMDPETSFDETGVNVGIMGGRIIEVTKEKIKAQSR